MNEDKIKHTKALTLCSQLTKLQHQISSLQHELVLHYAATGVPASKTEGKVNGLISEMHETESQLETIQRELRELDR